jgi:hypothetical protein
MWFPVHQYIQCNTLHVWPSLACVFVTGLKANGRQAVAARHHSVRVERVACVVSQSLAVGVLQAVVNNS